MLIFSLTKLSGDTLEKVTSSEKLHVKLDAHQSFLLPISAMGASMSSRVKEGRKIIKMDVSVLHYLNQCIEVCYTLMLGRCRSNKWEVIKKPFSVSCGGMGRMEVKAFL